MEEEEFFPCPECGHEVKKEEGFDGDPSSFCGNCGWDEYEQLEKEVADLEFTLELLFQYEKPAEVSVHKLTENCLK